MKTKLYRSISLILAILLTISSVDLKVCALEREEEFEEELVVPPLSYREIPGEWDCESIREHRASTMLTADRGVFPSAYGFEDIKDYLPTTRNQNPYGTCWAHSVLAAAEIGLIKNGGCDRSKMDLSELQLVYFMYHTPTTDPLGLVVGDSNSYAGTGTFMDSGNVNLAKKILQGWIGAGKDEGELAYENAGNVKTNGLDESLAFQDIYHLKNYYNVNIEERDEAKQAIMQYGAITASYYDKDTYRNSSNAAFYCNDTSITSTNHAIAIVGWDDNYSASNFKATPPDDGAWLIRNSWSSTDSFDLSKGTYFWMSYYDVSLKGSVAVEFEPANLYDNNYHYDGSAADLVYSVTSGTKIANVFTAKGAEETESLRAVSFETNSVNVIYQIDIYKDLMDAADPESGTLCASEKGMTSFSGYYTVSLTEYVPLEEGDTFSVVVKMSLGDESKVKVPREKSANEWYVCKANSNSGESFYKTSDNASWVDEGAKGEGNFRIKAFTVNTGAKIHATDLELEESELVIPYGESRSVKAHIIPKGATEKNVIWSSSDEGIVTVSKGEITAQNVGEATITATLDGNPAIKAECKVTVIPTLQVEDVKYTGETINVDYDHVMLGKTFDLSARVIPELSTKYTLRWTSDTPTVVKVSEKGSAAAVGAGTAQITVYAEEDADITTNFTVKVDCLDYVQAEHALSEEEDSATITWKPVVGADHYILRIGKNTILEDDYAEYRTSGCSYVVGELEAGAVYNYRIMAYSSDDTLQSGGCNSYSFAIAPIHEITYMMSGGINDDQNPVRVKEGRNYPLRQPKRLGYTFTGWYLENDPKTKITDIPADNNEDLTICAGWKPNAYTVFLDSNGGSALEPETVYFGNAYGAMKVPVRKGYTFAGWYTAKEGGEKVTEESIYVLSENQTLYAHWEINYYTVLFDANGGKVEAKPLSLTILDPYGELPVPVLEKHVFLGWYTAREDGVRVTEESVLSFAEDHTLYACWKQEEDWGDISTADREDKGFVTAADVPQGLWFAGIHDEKYTGKAVTFPELHVYNGKILLSRDRDYTVKYHDNVNAGTASVTITGKGNYIGSVTQMFSIDPLEIGEAQACDIGLPYNGKIQKGTTTVTYCLNGIYVTLKNGTDFTFAYPDTAAGAYSEVGDYRVEVTGRGNYTGKLTFTETISRDRISLSKVTVASIPKQNYTSSGIDPEGLLRLSYNKTTLRGSLEDSYNSMSAEEKEAYDYIYSVCDNLQAGTARIKIKGVNGYVGERTVRFQIVAKPVKNLVVKGIDSSYVYTGQEIQPAGAPEETNDAPSGFAVTVKSTGEKLIKGKDYIVSYSNNKKIGKATLMITGINAYSGTLKKTFNIKAYNINSDRIKVADIGTVPYEKGGAKPAVTVIDTRTGATLVQGRDYTVSYANNKAVKSGSKTPTATITGKGSYCGKVKKTFSISRSTLANTSIAAKDIVYKNKANICKTTIVLTDANGVKLKAGTDYERAVRYEYATDVTVKTTFYTEEFRSAGTEVNKTDIIPAGAVIRAVVRGKGNYAADSSQTVTFRYVAADISKATVKVTAQTYTGRAVEPGKNEIKVMLGKTELSSDEYEIIGYRNNVAKGTGKVIIRGTGMYGGEKTVNFTIKKYTL